MVPRPVGLAPMIALGLFLVLSAAPGSAVVIELLEEPTYFATRGMCDDYTNFTKNKHAADISVWHTLPFDSNWTIGVRIQVDPVGTGGWVEKGAEQDNRGRGRRLEVGPDTTAASVDTVESGMLHGEASEHAHERRKLSANLRTNPRLSYPTQPTPGIMALTDVSLCVR